MPKTFLLTNEFPPMQTGIARMMGEIADALRPVFGTAGPVVIFPSSGTGALEAAIVNSLKPGDRVLMFETGQFATLWRKLAARLGVIVDFIPGAIIT